MDKRKLAAEGFTAYETDLLITQLQRLEGRTQASWVFCADPQSKLLDLLIVHGEAAPPPAFTSLALKVTTGALVAPYHLAVAYPIRVFELLALLQNAETMLQDRASARAATALTSDEPAVLPRQLLEELEGWYRVGDLVLGRDAGTGSALLSNQASVECIVQALSTGPLCKLEVRPALGLEVVDFDALCWRLALRESVELLSWQDERKAYQIQRWPVLDCWYTEPWMLKLSALYARAPASLAEGVVVCEESPLQVAQFLHAAQVCGLGLALHVKTISTSVSAHSAGEPEASGFWGKLRRRLR